MNEFRLISAVAAQFAFSTAKKLSFHVKIVKIGPADLQIICLQEITEGKIYSPAKLVITG